ncbi:MAG: DEAD/DEAH box helicase, partial [Bryobacter sp.]|nr:DEAD/DEAH box helicase [Bryobacter sp.]
MSNPAVRELVQDLARHPALAEVVRRLDRAAAGERVDLSGLTTTAKALHLVLIWQLTGKPLLVVTDGNRQAETLFESLATFFELLVEDTHARPQLLPALDVLPHQNLSPHSELVERRAVGLWRLATGAAPVTVTPVGSLLLKTASANSYRQLALHLTARDEIPMEDFVAHLESIGYERREPVEMVGEFSVRGGIIDVFPAEASKPLRIEFFGDEIESLRRFEVESQRSVAKVGSATILPLSELPRTRSLLTRAAEKAGASRAPLPGELFPGWEYWVPLVEPRTDSLLSLAPQNLLVWDEIEQCHAAADRLWKRLDDAAEADSDVRELALNEASFFRWGELQLAATERPRLLLRELGLEAPGSLEIRSQPSPGFRGSIREAVQQARQFVEKGSRVAFFAPSTGETERLADIFQEYELPFQLVERKAGAAARAYEAGEVAGVLLLKGAVRRGVVFPESRLALFGTDDLFEAPEAVARPAAVRADLGAFAADIADLRPGDLVVHTTHGVGRFRGVKEIAQGDQTGDFMLIEYAGEAKLYVPLTRMDLIQKYRGGESGAPLDKLGGVTWARTKSKVKAKMRDMADELLKLYAQRRMAAGFAFSPDSNWQREFEDAFEFSATKDQTQATTEIKRDMQSDQPMDRLLCGDVGFGKTEVAMRAAFKALGDGKQVAVLAPTTVLAFQHYETFRRRFAAFPVRIELLSRFRTAKEIKQVLADLAAGKVDLLIGTHRLLSKDVEFADLGLLVVDEEQRFGVRHKERLKQIRANVDSLTMSATPIPRTLHMSLLGIRD